MRSNELCHKFGWFVYASLDIFVVPDMVIASSVVRALTEPVQHYLVTILARAPQANASRSTPRVAIYVHCPPIMLSNVSSIISHRACRDGSNSTATHGEKWKRDVPNADGDGVNQCSANSDANKGSFVLRLVGHGSTPRFKISS